MTITPEQMIEWLDTRLKPLEDIDTLAFIPARERHKQTRAILKSIRDYIQNTSQELTLAYMTGYEKGKDAAKNTSASGCPEGWVLVPKEPTEEMQEAHDCHVFDEFPDCWKAILFVTPDPLKAS